MSNWYGQHDEDRYITAFFGDFVGTYLDVGAFDGIAMSNTYALEQRGWSGVCVEPYPQTWAKLFRNRTAMCLQACVANVDGVSAVTFKMLDVPELSGIDPNMDVVNNIYRNIGKSSSPAITETQVLAVSANDIIREHLDGACDFLSVDTEGTELDVLKSVRLGACNPRLIVVERNDAARVDTYLSSHGYLLAGTIQQNGFYVQAADYERMKEILNG